jgi:excinuclease ABC subunit A
VSEILIQNARAHNLRDLSCRIPLGSLTVITGVSGSGKSTLAFDTLYAEGQRRYVTSLSTYARQFLERLPRPDVDSISNLPPAIAIERRNRVTSARSTVGTATEILDHLRLLFAKIGETRCPDCDRRVEPGTVEAVAERIRARFGGRRVSVGAPVAAPPGEPGAWREALLREGYGRLLGADGAPVDLADLAPQALAALQQAARSARGVEGPLLLVDRLAVPAAAEAAAGGEAAAGPASLASGAPRAPQPGGLSAVAEPPGPSSLASGPPRAPLAAGRARLAEAVANAFARGGGACVVVSEGGERAAFRRGFACDGCGKTFPAPEPALFSFNSPRGACPECEGFGRVPGLDRERILPDPAQSLERGAIAPFRTPRGQRWQRRCLRACREAGVPVDRPVGELTPAQRDWLFEGGPGWPGVRGYFERLERKRYKVGARVLIARYRAFTPCPACGGARLRPAALQVRVGGLHLGELAHLTLAQLLAWIDGLELGAGERERAGRLLEELRARVATANAVGLGYMALERPMRTLSGGEAQRIQLAAALGGTLTASLYVLDEPSIGLHALDARRLVETLRRIRDQGNTVVVVEHDPEIVAAADHLIDLGPGGGRQGGRLVAEGSVAEVRAHPESQTGRALRGELAPPRRAPRRATGRLRVVGARANNLRDLDVDLPLGQLVAVTGVSGAGKSTLVRSVLVGGLRRDPDRGACARIEGAATVREVVLVEPNPPARSPRSNPATVSKAFEAIRARFAATREARALGAGPGWFSFNVPGGRCEACEGAGEVVVDMQFLEDVRMPCEACDGRRYRPEIAQVRVGGLSIVDVLALTVDEAIALFDDDPQIARRLRPLAGVGLGYLALGQPLSTLSGGEIQRLRLAQALAERDAGSLYVLDEPTTGLHPADVRLLLDCLDQVIAAGSSVLVVEHNLDVIRSADFVIDLGPGAGPQGGRLVVAGAPEAVARCAASYTGAALRSLGLGRGPA